MIRIQRAAGRAEVPWKNGGGVTREVAAWPPGTGSGEFDWRISIASVDRGGPFSVFPGVDRELAVLEGTLRLAIEGRADMTVSSGTPSVHFPGDVPCSGDPGAAPVTDLNVMTRRGKVSSRITWIAVERQQAIRATATRTFLLAADAVALLTCGLTYSLHAQDLAELQPEDGEVTLVAPSARCVLIELIA